MRRTFFILLLSAYFTEIIGIHALISSFIAGIIMPKYICIQENLNNKVETVRTILLLPIFFAFTGLRTQIGLLIESHLWLYFAVNITAAIVGKPGGSAITAKAVGRL